MVAMPGPGMMPFAGPGMMPYAQFGGAQQMMGAVPYGGMPAAYMMPYYVMPNNMHAAQPFMPAVPPIAPAPQLSPAERTALTTQVQGQIEYYFGIENLLKDVFLRKHMTAEEGYVPISVIANFNCISNMTRDPSILIQAISTSQLVEISPQNTHIRLKNDWPRWILATQQGASTVPAAAPQQRAAQ